MADTSTNRAQRRREAKYGTRSASPPGKNPFQVRLEKARAEQKRIEEKKTEREKRKAEAAKARQMGHVYG